MIQSKSAAQAKKYFRDALAKADYYLSDQELPGLWQGKLAARLGLNGTAGKEDFFALSDNRHPDTGENLTPRTRQDRTTGYDINFHCPKSVSVLHALSHDNHILKAFRESVTEIMQMIEADSQTRVRLGGVSEDRTSGELVWAQFVHQTARPVEGVLPDPHLHAHCFTFNATWDGVEERIKAGQFRETQRNMPYYQTEFHKCLADKMADLGYQVRRGDKSFEIEGVPETVIRHFSKRTDQIGRVAAEKGITDVDELGALGARTRGKKDAGLTMEELKAGWKEQMKALGTDQDGDEKKTIRSTAVRDAPSITAQQCVDHAVLHCFERASVMEERRLLSVAIRRAVGVPGVSSEDIRRAFAADDRIIRVEERGRSLCTTKEVLTEERRMVELAQAGRGQIRPLYETAPDITLLGQQGEAIRHILTTRDLVSIVRGVAGSGKTTLMTEAVEKIKAAGKTVVAVAPTARASRGVLREAGFKDATTVAQLLRDTSLQKSLKNQVLMVDEAGLLGTQDTAALLDLATQQNAQVIFVGDTRQHTSVVRGDALRILNTVGGVPVAEVAKIYRQTKQEFREVVKELSDGQVADAFHRLDGMGCIRHVADGTLVGDYVTLVKSGKTGLVISPTHAQGDEITESIRGELRKQGLLGKKEITVSRLQNLNFTEAELRDPKNYTPGQVVQFNQNAPGIVRGSQWRVDRTTAEEVFVRNADGESRSLPLDKSDRFDVFETGHLTVAKGDRVQITRNGYDVNRARLNNGDLLTVERVYVSGKMILKNETSRKTYTLHADHGHVAHAHCVTSQASQGMSVNEVFVYQPSATFPATDARQFYVSVSRVKDMVHIYTDDKEDLLAHATRLRERQSATELIGQSRDSHEPDTWARQNIEYERKNQTRERDDYEPDI